MKPNKAVACPVPALAGLVVIDGGALFPCLRMPSPLRRDRPCSGAVRLAAAIGVPDPVRTESIKAFLVLAQGQQPSQALQREIGEFAKTRLARHEYPRAIEFVDSLPMTTTGKMMRRALRERERAKARTAT